MRLHYLQHVPFEGLGYIESWSAAAGFSITVSRMYAGDWLPPVDEIDWLVIMGGPMNVYQEIDFPWLKKEKTFIERSIEKDKTILGICLGAQLIADVLGAAVKPNYYKEIGWFPVYKSDFIAPPPLASVFPDAIDVLHWHGDTFDLPAGAYHLASSRACKHQAFIYGHQVVGLQFHLETTAAGLRQLFDQFANEIDDSPFVQQPKKMLAEPQRFARANQAMKLLLDAMAEKTRR